MDKGFEVGDDELKALADIIVIDNSFDRGWFGTGDEHDDDELIALTEAVGPNEELDLWFLRR